MLERHDAERLSSTAGKARKGLKLVDVSFIKRFHNIPSTWQSYLYSAQQACYAKNHCSLSNGIDATALIVFNCNAPNNQVNR